MIISQRKISDALRNFNKSLSQRPHDRAVGATELLDWMANGTMPAAASSVLSLVRVMSEHPWHITDGLHQWRDRSRPKSDNERHVTLRVRGEGVHVYVLPGTTHIWQVTRGPLGSIYHGLPPYCAPGSAPPR